MTDPQTTVTQRQLPNVASVTSVPSAVPHCIGRYRVERILGRGGFGLVYLAHDDQLHRLVAIKVPHAHLVTRDDAIERYLLEARTVAGLDHPNVVPVYDVGGTAEFPCFVVSKYIDGTDLAARLNRSRVPLREAVALVATTAEALHYAHTRGLVHRDVKPGNILLDATDRPFVADFGLALRERDAGTGPGFAGTPAYMSPEQARGEGHRVDCRSDVFSLGVVFYELLVGRRPFNGDSQVELLEQVIRFEPRPPRQCDDAIPGELERVCLKALAKRASERYATAKDMADDLRHLLGGPSGSVPTVGGSRSAPLPHAPTESVPPASENRAIKIVPKGLRSFDAHDADFFLELLPGPRDRDGLPDSVRFWKTRLEETDADNTFTVGLIYGPSGCGKSSLVKAGLLPRLSGDVTAVYVEATADETEVRLLRGLRKHCPALPENAGLTDALAALRRGHGLPAGKKVVVVLDQFEQWLHAKRAEENAELVQALRQCDGGRVQCVLLVRDDFWLAVSRFLRELEVRLSEGQNSALVDLFPTRHAANVLAAFGRAFGALPAGTAEMSRGQRRFLERAVEGLAQEGKVVCVRLALFAEMMKGKPWTPDSLNAVGGTEGVGIAFLEETFSAGTAPPAHRLHQPAVLSVLKILLPEAWSEIKGHMRSQQELLHASGYSLRPNDFEELVQILDGELRLITPTDPEGGSPGTPTEPGSAGIQYYQLTHDYLVPSVREWLIRKQKETRRGRTEMRLAVWSSVWNAKPERRNLPSWWEWAGIRAVTRRKDWTAAQRKMMRAAGRFHTARGLAVLVLLALIGWGGYEGHGRLQAQALRNSLLNADTNGVPAIVAEMAPYRKWADPLLRDAATRAETDGDARKQLHVSLALLPTDATQVDYLYGRLLDAEPHEVPVIRDALVPYKDGLLNRLWATVEIPGRGKEAQRIRAASALARYDPVSAKWATTSAPVAGDLVRENAVFLGQWSEALRPVKGHLLVPLSAVFRDRRPDRSAERSLATNVLADYAADQSQVLADLLLDADAKQFAVIFPTLKERGGRGLPTLLAEIGRTPEAGASDEAKEQSAQRRANAAVALLRMGHPDRVWPLLKHGPDARVRSYLVHHLCLLGAEAGALVARLRDEPDVAVRRALLLSLGEFDEKALAPAERGALLPGVREVYRTAADPGLHAAGEWVLRAWGEEAWLKRTNEAWAADREQRDRRLREARGASAPGWYVNDQGQTLVVVPGPVEFLMGSPTTELSRQGGPADPLESQHRRRIGRSFAIANKEVTVEQFRRFRPDHKHNEQSGRHPDCPVNNVTWYAAAAYCNWLSERDGIPEGQWCYEPQPGKGLRDWSADAYSEGMRVRPNYLSLAGYRLPSEAEWEFAARAGAVTSRYYGESAELLSKYAWYTKNSNDRGAERVGVLKPNDLGLFDMLGNVQEWCQDAKTDYPRSEGAQLVEDVEDVREAREGIDRILRGRSYNYLAGYVRSANRNWNRPSLQYDNVGFRPARTVR